LQHREPGVGEDGELAAVNRPESPGGLVGYATSGTVATV
jgi:hypothetical protein